MACSLSLQHTSQGQIVVFNAIVSPDSGWTLSGSVRLANPFGTQFSMTNTSGNIWTFSTVQPVQPGQWTASATFSNIQSPTASDTI